MVRKTPLTMMSIPLFIPTLCLFALLSCTSPSAKDDALRLPDDASPEARYALTFERLVRNELSENDKNSFFTSCSEPKPINPYCPALSKRRELEARLQRLHQLPEAPEARPTAPVLAEIKDGQVANWKALRRAKVRPLIKGLENLPFADLEGLAKKALAEKRCPNTIAAAVAASMETYLPDRTSTDTIAALWAKGAKCLPRSDDDRDHLLIRAGLFAYWRKNYGEAARLLAKVPSNDAFLGRHLYWLARAQLQLGKKQDAARTIARLQRRHPLSFHATLAEWGNTLPVQKSSETVEPRSKRRPAANAWIALVESLNKYQAPLARDFLAEYTLDRFPKLESPVRRHILGLAAAQTKVEWSAPLLLRASPPFSSDLLSLGYPLYEAELFSKNSNGVDPLLLTSLARKESHFNPRAVSPARAQGLLQLLPETAAKQESGSLDLFDKATNIRVGSKYFATLLKLFDQKIPLAIAAYNAGEEAVFKWRARYTTTDPVLFLDLIPFRETREYVGFVMTNYFWYSKLYQPTVQLSCFQELSSSELALK